MDIRSERFVLNAAGGPLIPRLMVMVGSMRLPFRVPLFAVVMVVVVAALVTRVRRGVDVGDDELGAVLGRLAVVPAAVLAAGCLVQLLPRLPVVAVQAAPRLRGRRVKRGDRVAVG